MHIIQEKLIKLADSYNLSDLTLRKIGELVHEPNSPQKIKHHINQLIGKGLLVVTPDGKKTKKMKGGLGKSGLLSLPILGSANCGQALIFADEKIEGYLKLSRNLLEKNLINKIKELFVLKAVGNSMNRAVINNKNIEDGDFVIISKGSTAKNGDCVVSIIDGVVNIKKFYIDKPNNQIILLSESSQDFPPIYISKKDQDSYLICGKVVRVMKKPDEMALMRDASSVDILDDLGDISREEVEYYENL
ncbi:MAG TPA: S24 family peptidase [Candidatus Pacearchaeota archaeon]|nr:S24 family peptidase [Candidatus Pacearchaeota archaeon]HPR79604.1 S24 family peptidase [Candidatus Pacearchaeota archaeon]